MSLAAPSAAATLAASQAAGGVAVAPKAASSPAPSYAASRGGKSAPATPATAAGKSAPTIQASNLVTTGPAFSLSAASAGPPATPQVPDVAIASQDDATSEEALDPLAAATLAAQPDSPGAAAAADPGLRSAADTVASFSAEMARRLDGQNSRFSIELDPAGLGRVAVAMEIRGDGKLTASLSFDRADAASLVGGRADELRQALAQSGFHLAADALRFDIAPQTPTATATTGGQSGQSGSWSTGSDGSGSQRGGGSPRPPPPVSGFLTSASDYPTATAAGGLDIRI